MEKTWEHGDHLWYLKKSYNLWTILEKHRVPLKGTGSSIQFEGTWLTDYSYFSLKNLKEYEYLMIEDSDPSKKHKIYSLRG